VDGIDLLADELDVMQRTLEQQVTERTEELDRARRAMARALLGGRIGQATARVERGARPPCPVLLDLDGFKTINDEWGHDAGDRVLVEVARRLTGVVRAADTVARLGGDEFAVLLPDVTDDEAVRVAQRAVRALRPPVTVAGWAVLTSASIGVCLGRRGQSTELLLRDADTAMCAAKAGGRGAVRVFHGRMHDAARQRLQRASENWRTPPPSASYGCTTSRSCSWAPAGSWRWRRCCGWLHPERGVLPPAAFLRAAEDSGHPGARATG